MLSLPIWGVHLERLVARRELFGRLGVVLGISIAGEFGAGRSRFVLVGVSWEMKGILYCRYEDEAKLELRKSVVQDQVSGFLAILRLLGVTEDLVD